MNRELKAKREEYFKILTELRQLESEEKLKVDLPKAKALINSYWKYRNSYSDASKSWWLYAKVVSVEDTCALIVRQCEIDINKRVMMETLELTIDLFPRDGWIESSETEWNTNLSIVRAILGTF